MTRGADGALRSEVFGDVYYQPGEGLAESAFVFLEGNRLKERFAALQPGERFVIGELGFGTGLNVLAAAALFEAEAPQGASLEVISFEGFPLSPETLQAALSAEQGVAEQAAALLDGYPLALPGMHVLTIGRARLVLVYGEIGETLGGTRFQADAWFLDGFAPSVNPAMWSAEVLQQVAERTGPGGTFATFTAAGQVRRDLQSAGFEVHKRPGYGRKRERLVGVKQDAARPKLDPPWLGWPDGGQGDVLVIGGGLAGCATANALAARGVKVTLLERGRLASAASGNRQAVVEPALEAGDSARRRWFAGAFAHAVRKLDAMGEVWRPCGVLRLANERERRAAERMGWPSEVLEPVTREQASARAGLDVGAGGLWCGVGGWVDPAGLCRALVQDGVSVHEQTQVLRVAREAQRWCVQTQAGEWTADRLVFTAASEAAALLGADAPPWVSTRGQVTYVRAACGLKSVVCHTGYVTPGHEGVMCVGATFDEGDGFVEARPADDARNFAGLRDASEALALSVGKEIAGARVAFRCVTPDRLPVVGPVCALAGYREAYGDLWKGGRDGSAYPSAPVWPGAWLLSGLGSRGVLSALWGAEVLAAGLCGEVLPVDEMTRQAVHPARFWVRALKRKEGLVGRGGVSG